MISEALEFRVEGGRVSLSWCRCVGIHGYCGLGGGWDSGGRWYAYETNPGGLVASREMPEHIPNAR